MDCVGEAMNECKTSQVLHVFWDFAPHLSRSLAPMTKRLFPTHLFALYQTSKEDAWFKYENDAWCVSMGASFFGQLQQSFIRQFPLRGRIGSLVMRFFPELSLKTWAKLLFGPKRIILHGRCIGEFNLFTLLGLRLFGKKVFLIHWGGGPSFGQLLGFLDRLAYRCFSHVFVLMSPEIDYFKPFMGARVSCLPYPHRNLENNTVVLKGQGMKNLLLGNSAHFRETYCEVLDRLNPTDWDKITCMLNYGDEHSADQTDAFVAKYHARFGEKLFAWRETLPLQQYLQIMAESAFYICIAPHQTGLGAISNSIRQGKTIILRGDNLKWMRSLGVKVYDYDELPDLSFATLQKLRLTPEEAQVSYDNFNKNAIQKYTTVYWAQQIEETLNYE